MGVVRNAQNEYRVWRMIPSPVVSAASASAATYGSGGATTRRGIVDTRGAHTAVIRVSKNVGTAGKLSFRLYHQSGAATLVASATSVASAYFCGVTVSTAVREFHINLRGRVYKRYLNCKVTMSTNSSVPEVQCILFDDRQWPTADPSTTTVLRILS